MLLAECQAPSPLTHFFISASYCLFIKLFKFYQESEPCFSESITELFPQALSLSPPCFTTGVLPHTSTAQWVKPLLKALSEVKPDKNSVDMLHLMPGFTSGEAEPRLGSQWVIKVKTHHCPHVPWSVLHEPRADHSLTSPCHGCILFPNNNIPKPVSPESRRLQTSFRGWTRFAC